MLWNESTALRARRVAPPWRDRLAAGLVLRQLEGWRMGLVQLELPDGRVLELGEPRAARRVAVRVREWRFFRRALVGGDLGVGESYMDGDWDCDDLVELCRMFIEDQSVLSDRSTLGVLKRLSHALQRLARANSLHGSRRNIQYHYDLSNDLFRLFLDESMTYSAAVFARPGTTLEEAQRAKLDGICRQLELEAGQHVLEIGSGWGAFAIHAASQYGCRVTSLTLSQDQLALARQRVAAAGLSDRIDIRLCDYRQMTGSFDHIVSIEMFEAVGLEYYDTFFAACERLLRPHGRLFLQTIAIPDQRFEAYARDYDWVRKYIFPGSLLASLHAITASLKRVTTLRIDTLRDIGPDYARTLQLWRERFVARRHDVRRLGFDERFIRMWDFYLASCEAGFAARYINDLQLVMSRPLPFARAR
ncbi:MAG: class I SAM-dependent methyltransferase, partial [Candidatus Binatia bacterium]